MKRYRVNFVTQEFMEHPEGEYVCYSDLKPAVSVVMLKGLLKAADGMAGDRARHEKANAYDFLVEQLQHHIDQARGGCDG